MDLIEPYHLALEDHVSSNAKMLLQHIKGQRIKLKPLTAYLSITSLTRAPVHKAT